MSGYGDITLFAKAVRKGMKFYNMGLYYRAIKYFKYALEIAPARPNNAQIYMLIGISYHKLGLSDRAYKYLEKAIELGDFVVTEQEAKECVEILCGKCISFFLEGKYDEAGDLYDLAWDIDQDYTSEIMDKYANDLEEACLALSESGEYDRAIECWEAMMCMCPNKSSETFSGFEEVCYSLYEDGFYDEALECYDKLLEIDPEDASAWNYKGLSLCDLGKYEEAIKCFDEWIRIERGD